MDERPEASLVDDARRGGREAFAELVRRHERRVRGIALRMAGNAADAAAQAGDPQSRARLRERISDLYLLRLTGALELTEEQTAKLYPVLTRTEKEKAALQRDMGLDLRNLRAELAKTPPGEKEVLDFLRNVGENLGRVRRGPGIY